MLVFKRNARNHRVQVALPLDLASSNLVAQAILPLVPPSILHLVATTILPLVAPAVTSGTD